MKKWMNAEQCSAYLGISIHTLYQYVSKRKVPFNKIPKSNLIRFDVEKIDEWISSGYVETAAEALRGGK